MLKKIYLLLFVSVFLTANNLCGQLDIKDSLLNTIKKQKQLKNFKETDTVYINSLLELGKEQRYYQLDSLFLLASQALELSKIADYSEGKIKAYLAFGSFYSDNGKNDEAIDYFLLASKLAFGHDNSELLLRANIDLGMEYAYKGDYAMALKKLLEVNELAASVNNEKMLSISYENIANLYFTQKEYDQAILFYEKTKKINKKIGNPIYTAQTLSNTASALTDVGELDQAMFNINRSITTFEDKKIIDWLAYAYEVKGKIYLKKNKNEWAMYWYRQSELLHKNLEDDRSEISLLNGMGEASLNLKQDSIAELYANKSYILSKNLGDIDGTKQASEILYTINKNKGDYESALSFHEHYQKLSDTIAKRENEKGVTMLKTKIEFDQQKEQLILENEKALSKQKTYVYAVLIILLIFCGITLLIRRNGKIQKSLNKKLVSKTTDLEKKEEHLKDVNHTKDKLFSIIGHDLRGPIGAFQGLLKLFKEGEMTKEEFLSFVPKLKTDIDHISFTLNNLLSWGQTQMNGTSTRPTANAVENIVEENIALLSEIASVKSIKLINRIESNTLAWSDANQIDIVVRNLISNALKFTQQGGTITIGAIEKTKSWEIYVKDNGIGMDEETMGKIFKKDSTHTTYGTNDEKGTGLGLSLCKEMVEKNKGLIWVNSALNKGSSFYFTVPKAKKEYKKTA